MPIIKSAKKRAKQELVRNDRNTVTRRRVKDARKALAAAQTVGTKKKVDDALKEYQSALDTSVKKNIMHKNRAARLLSRAMSTDKKPVTKKPVAKKTE